jgi:hypothetical protein
MATLPRASNKPSIMTRTLPTVSSTAPTQGRIGATPGGKITRSK